MQKIASNINIHIPTPMQKESTIKSTPIKKSKLSDKVYAPTATTINCSQKTTKITMMAFIQKSTRLARFVLSCITPRILSVLRASRMTVCTRRTFNFFVRVEHLQFERVLYFHFRGAFRQRAEYRVHEWLHQLACGKAFQCENGKVRALVQYKV